MGKGITEKPTYMQVHKEKGSQKNYKEIYVNNKKDMLKVPNKVLVWCCCC